MLSHIGRLLAGFAVVLERLFVEDDFVMIATASRGRG